MPLCKPYHSAVGLQRIDFGHFARLVMNEVCAGTRPDLQDRPVSQRHEPLSNFPDGLRVAENAYQTRVDMMSVKWHSYVARSWTSESPAGRPCVLDMFHSTTAELPAAGRTDSAKVPSRLRR